MSAVQAKGLMEVVDKHPLGDFDLYEDTIAGKRALIVEVSEYDNDTVSQRDADIHRYLITLTFEDGNWISRAVLI